MKIITFLVSLFMVSVAQNAAAQITSPAPYCVATFDDEFFNVPNAINTVSFGTLSNATNAQSAAPHYIFYNNLPVANFVKGTAYTLTVNFEVNGGCGYGVWIDYNKNNIFEVSEKVSGTPVGESLDFDPNSTITQSVTIPTTAATGQTRMRIRIVEDDTFSETNGYATLPCNASASSDDVMNSGETEDYTINISAALGNDDFHKTNNFIVYPNPVTTVLQIAQNLSDALNYKIVSITGREIQNGTLLGSKNEINVASLSEGIYFLQLFEGGEALGQQKFVKSAQ